MTTKPELGPWGHRRLACPRGYRVYISGARSRIGMITGLFGRKSEYRIRSVACLFYERV